MDKSIPSSQLKAQCSRILDEVSRDRVSMTVTRRGRPVARIVPIEESAETLRSGFLRGTVTVHGDIVAPIDVQWEALG